MMGNKKQRQLQNQPKDTCIECYEKVARYWGSKFCEDCFRKLLQEKLEDEK